METGGFTPATLSALIALVRKHTGIAMTERKSVLLERRIRPRVQALNLGSYQAYLDKVEQDRAEIPHFIDLVTTNDTLFFRTPQVWDYVEKEFLPQWWQAHQGKRLKVWSAAASSGEELYSMAMLCEEFAAAHPGFSYQIHATDISQQILALARDGQYTGRSVERIQSTHPDWVRKYFRPSANGLRVVDALKKNVELAQHNLLTPLKPARQFDLVFLRNVLIYFDQEQQQAILNQARPSMAPHAVMIVGESESISGLNTAYQFDRPMIYRME
ncbi:MULTISPECIES: protein-glutamate O-methyltransferase CheR [unclassified Duganella]|uniref:CheR family methyltransferase n=1 Tax=unclassified Duganella TaxID=2636909 RepID=UPI0008830216|nr:MULTISPECIES: protein-glutamate O-methyltransferase CheR [unclassified Duganella]SDG80980.1 chemotaxis protein methyltransferase CheR [Duganella sp. OV458]SDK08262.1 chemotaxis protein methyltransferase CheR [Duganella sp. OV510]